MACWIGCTADGIKTLRQRTLQLFQLFLLIVAVYALLKYTGNQRLLVSVTCLFVAFLVGKLETGIGERGTHKKDHTKDASKQEQRTETSQALDWLSKSKRAAVLIDAVQCLLRDLGLEVSPSADYPAVDRLIRIPEMKVTWGLKVLGDVGDLNENWKAWEALASFDLDRGGKRRLLIVASNCAKEAGAGQQGHKDFPVDAKKLVSDRHVVAISTRTLGKIYLSCKENKVDIKTVFHSLQYHPGGVF